MTLVLSTATQAYALQVSDRQTSTMRGPSPYYHPYDTLANKSIVLRATDALVTLAYSGAAFVNNDPTDHWLVEQIVAQPVDGTGFPEGGPPVSDLGQMILRIAYGYEDWPKSAQKHGLQLAMCGFQISRKSRWRQVLWRLHSSPDGSRLVAWQMVPRHHPARQVRATNATPHGMLANGEVRALITELEASADVINDFDDAERVLINCVRAAAKPGSGVGPDCMAVAIAPFHLDHVRVRYRPLADPGVSPGTIAYAPWIIGPGILAPPAEILGGGTWAAGALKVVIEAPPVPEGAKVFASLRTQRRKPPPGRRRS